MIFSICIPNNCNVTIDISDILLICDVLLSSHELFINHIKMNRAFKWSWSRIWERLLCNPKRYLLTVTRFYWYNNDLNYESNKLDIITAIFNNHSINDLSADMLTCTEFLITYFNYCWHWRTMNRYYNHHISQYVLDKSN